MATQRRFAVMGENLFKVANKIVNNQKLCRLLKYQDLDPLDTEKHSDVNGFDLLHKQIILVPKYPEDEIEHSYIMAVFSGFSINPMNPDFKTTQIRFDIVCPYSEWIINDSSLRPYLIMEEIDKMFNQAKLNGIGNLQFVSSDLLTLSPQLGGYTLRYQINEFN